MRISELCKMIEDSIHSERYPLGGNSEKEMAHLAQVINRSSSDDMKDEDIKIEVRVKNLYVLNNYISNIKHLPGAIEMDVVDSFKMLCRRLERLDQSSNENNIAFRIPK